ncbi:3'5'-cyclic nucleotide phosphodiesterase, partial [Ancylostoma caninum]
FSYWKPEPSPTTDGHSSHLQSSPGTSSGNESPSLKKNAIRKESGSLCDTVVTTVDGQQFDTRELDGDRGMSMVADWSLPIFEIAEKHQDTVLSRLTYTVFKQADLFRIFKLSPIKFFNFFHALERGYWDIPYHNRVHAADVLHGCYYLTCHPVRPLIGPTTSPDSLLPPPLTPAAPISASMSTLELMALYTAAAMHDYDHPGRTNAFLVAAEDKKAILYNDRSVLENHHAAESWRLLQLTENNFIETLDPAETKRFRYLVLEYILATDLKQHFEIIMMFNEKSSEMELLNESDRLLMAKMIIKMADINSPTKPYGLHRQWTDRICQEFYEQGDEERKRGMPITPYMDRTDAQVAKLQDSFIAHVVSPLALAMNEAGLLPILPGLVEPEMMINLKHNHQKWLHEIDSANAEAVPTLGNGVIEEESSTSESPDNRKCSPSLDSEVEEQFDMCTIHEHDEEEYL